MQSFARRPNIAPVIKVGGSILRSRQDYEIVARLLRPWIDAGSWVVVSAAHGITDFLEHLSRDRQQDSVWKFLAAHADIVGVSTLAELEEELAAAVLDASVPDNVLLSWGERSSAAALRTHLDKLGARIPIVELPCQCPLPPHRAAIVPGFYMRDARGRIHMLPRGGSDISAVLLAMRLGATQVRLWKNGGGIHETVNETSVFREISGFTLLNRLGNTIHPLHPAALRLALRHGIELTLEDPQGRHPPTRIAAGTVSEARERSRAETHEGFPNVFGAGGEV